MSAGSGWRSSRPRPRFHARMSATPSSWRPTRRRMRVGPSPSSARLTCASCSARKARLPWPRPMATSRASMTPVRRLASSKAFRAPTSWRVGRRRGVDEGALLRGGRSTR
eukprot:13703122-Alexandrium_andersonii.AAC.1